MGPHGTAVITGASSGIGSIYADRLAARGYDLLVVARDAARLDTLAEHLRARDGVAVEVVPTDLGDECALGSLCRRIRDDDLITMLVNNAGIGDVGPLQYATHEAILQLLMVNVTAPTLLAAAAADNFLRGGAGTIINIGSVTALFPERLDPVYPATKAYLLSLTQSLEAKLEPTGIRVQAVLPGATRTEIWARSGSDVDALPPEIVMTAEDLVDAALAGLDLGERITIPSLPDASRWDEHMAVRAALFPDLSRREPAARYLSARAR